MALQFHPEYANLLAVGCYDGSLAVYDVCQKTNKPLYTAAAKAKRHTDTVWQVCWQVRTHTGKAAVPRTCLVQGESIESQ
jgi:dynein intermediate chain 1